MTHWSRRWVKGPVEPSPGSSLRESSRVLALRQPCLDVGEVEADVLAETDVRDRSGAGALAHPGLWDAQPFGNLASVKEAINHPWSRPSNALSDHQGRRRVRIRWSTTCDRRELRAKNPGSRSSAPGDQRHGYGVGAAATEARAVAADVIADDAHEVGARVARDRRGHARRVGSDDDHAPSGQESDGLPRSRPTPGSPECYASRGLRSASSSSCCHPLRTSSAS